MSRGLPENASITSRAIYSVGLGAIAAVVASLLDQVIADDDVSMLFAVTFGAFMAVFFFALTFAQNRRAP